MPLRFGQRLVPISALTAGFTFVLLIAGIALFAFGAFVNDARARATVLTEGAAQTIAASRTPLDAPAAARAIAPRLLDPLLTITFVDNTHRVTILRATGAAGSVSIGVRERADRGGEPQATGTFAHFVLGLATVFGYAVVRTRVGDLDIYGGVDEPMFAHDVAAFVPALLVALALAALGAIVLARILEREAVRPLSDVTAALQRFASGDFEPQEIFAAGDERLSALALAYNGAVLQVERALAERERAHATMRQFSSDAGHQLRTPLTVVRGFVTMLRRSELAADPESASMLRAMAQQSAIMSSLIDKLILLERWEALPERDRAGVDIGEVIADVVTPLALANADRDLRMESAIGTFVAVDAEMLGHALTNVVDNALKYTTGPIKVVMDVKPRTVEVSVTDLGPGMAPDQLARAFDRFFRGSRRDVEGSGLGLAIAKSAIEREGGSIELDSDVSRGTVVRIRVPRIEM